MRKKDHNRNLIIYVIVLLLIGCLYLYFSKGIEGFMGMGMGMGDEKHVWTFWDSAELPDIVAKCIQTWRDKNPGYKITVLNKMNLSEYLDVDFTKFKHMDSNQRFSDFVRLFILAKYGGIWCDASIICVKPFDSWIPQLIGRQGCDFVGFYIEGPGFTELLKDSPVIESWFFACSKGSVLVKDWLAEFCRLEDFDTVDAYVDSLRAEGVNLQNISTGYLTIHCAIQKVLQKGPNRPYCFEVLKAEDTAFKYLKMYEWDQAKSVENLIECKHGLGNYGAFNTPIIKLRVTERHELEKLDYSVLFKGT